ncbi:unnamed protein product [Rodentolepis nana]|uniref:Uncharacterized protein n=1 Tax=Rodentolepis nana TaxID=102285 RepID=A0A3P7VGI2_RODNA|nr:unnamed protein product [Rodentolepis nana]
MISALAGVYYYYKPTEESPLLSAINQKNRGNKFFKLGRYDKAIECYTLALEQCPLDSITDRATFYQNRAAARENLGEFENAIADCNSSLDLNPTYIKALNRRSRLLERTGNLQGSLLDITFNFSNNHISSRFFKSVFISFGCLFLPITVISPVLFPNYFWFR